MGIQTKSARGKFSRLRQSLLHLVSEMKQLVEPFFSDRPVIKGTVYELRRRCGKPGCKCAQGDLHARMVVSASEKGRTRLRVIPRGFLVEVQERVKRYQELRRVRARLVTIHRQMLRVLDEMEGMRREELPSSDKKGASKGE
ncbi:MAG: hypothetical protein MUP41_01555 [Desulfobacterales bacterium]|jgi:hypothetical protein|nr:hypothetical protein [Desulfobacterales bacterium]